MPGRSVSSQRENAAALPRSGRRQTQWISSEVVTSMPGDKADAGFFRFGSHGGTVARGIVIRDGDQLQPRFLGGF